MVMKFLFFRCLAFVVILSGAVFQVVAEDLDTALEAHKKAAQRRVYSDRALLDERNLTVPQTPTEEEKELDKKLRQMEARLDSQSAPAELSVMPRQTTSVPRPAEDKNWLTSALLDNAEAVTLTNETENSWLVQELERQKSLKMQESDAKENELVEKLLREKNQPQNSSPELDRLKKYQPVPQNILGGKDEDSGTPTYMVPQYGTPDPLAAVRFAPRKEKPTADPLFSPAAARSFSATENDMRTVKNPYSGLTARQPSSSAFLPDWDSNKAAPLTPMEMIRKSSPINRTDPFADDNMPQIKTSIWQ